VWNDFLVALVFLGKAPEHIVLTIKLNDLLGSRGESWEILTASAFVSIAVPVAVFFSLQRFFVRGLLSGSVKGG
jgi:alpha-glucoside transport system permease protein